MEGHSGAGYRNEGGGDGDADFFDRMRSDWSRDPAMFFGEDPRAAGWGFPPGMDPEMEEMRARTRPKFTGFERMRPGMFGPRPFQREHPSAGAEASTQDGTHAQSGTGPGAPGHQGTPPRGNGGERIIPIQIERDEGDGGRRSPQQHHMQPAASPRQQKKYVRRETADPPTMKLLVEETPRDVRAHSCPPPDAAGAAAAGAEVPVTVQPPPPAARGAGATSLDMNQGQQVHPHPHIHQKPNYFNSTPRPFSPEARTFQKAPAFPRRAWPPPEDDSTPIPVQVERSGPAKVGPKVPPKPQPQAQKPQHQQQHQNQQPERDEEWKPPPPPPKPKSAKEKAMDTIEAVRTQVEELSKGVDAFAGTKGEKQYLFLDEMLTRELIKLDDVETGGLDDVRAARKDTIKSIQRCLSRLEQKSTASVEAAKTELGEGVAMEAEQPVDANLEFAAVEEAAPSEAVASDAAPMEAESQPADVGVATAPSGDATATAAKPEDAAVQLVATEAAAEKPSEAAEQPQAASESKEPPAVEAAATAASPQQMDQS